MHKLGIKDFYIVEGWVKSKDEPYWRQHTWLEVDGQKIDPTFVQFDYLGKVKYVSRIKKKYTPEEYLSLSKKYPDEISDFKKYISKE